MRAAGAGLLVAGVLVLLPVTGRAEAGTVFFKDGGRINGDIVEVRPNQFVVVQTATGETRRIAWSEVDHVASAATPAKPPGPPPLQAPPPPPPSAPPFASEPEEAPTATIVLRSNAPATLLHLVTGRAAFALGPWYPGAVVAGQARALCTAPCRVGLPPGPHEVMVTAPGAPPASTRLDLHPGDNYVRARMGSSAMITGGYAAVTVGVLALLTGASLLCSYGFYPGSYYYAYPYSYSYYPGYFGWGLAGIIGGAVLTGGGIALIALGGSSVGPEPAPGTPPRTSGMPPARGLAWSIPF